MRWPASPFVLLAVFTSAPAVAFAASSGGSADCVSDLAAAGKLTELALARVSVDGRVHLQSDTAGCPGNEARCQLKPYVVKGDVLVAGHRRGPGRAWPTPIASAERKAGFDLIRSPPRLSHAALESAIGRANGLGAPSARS